MWRRSSNEEWERKKSYLIRSLFEDIPQLSNVSEETHSEIDALANNRERSNSPLPDLIIERMPNRHDEPEQYYEQLAIRMRKLHKKMFEIKHDTDSDENVSDNVEIPKLKSDSDANIEKVFINSSRSPYEHDSKTTKNNSIEDEDQTNATKIKTDVDFENTFSSQSPLQTSPESNISIMNARFKINVDQTNLSQIEERNEEFENTYGISSPSAIDLISNSTKLDSLSEADVDQLNFTEHDQRNDEFENTNSVISSPFQSDLNSNTKDTTDSNEDFGETNNSKSDKLNNDFGTVEVRQTTHSDKSAHSDETVEDIEKTVKYVSFHFNRKTLSTIPEESDAEKDNNHGPVLHINEGDRKHNHDSNVEEDNNNWDVSLVIPNSTRSTRASNMSFEQNEIEVMRGEAKTSVGSQAVYPENNSLLDKSFIASDISLEAEAQSTGSEEFRREIQRCSSPKISNEHNRRIHESSSKSENCDTEPVILSSRKRNSNSENTSLVVKKNKKDNAAQTDAINNATWDSLKRNFFAGVPKMYNLCSCKNHKCNP